MIPPSLATHISSISKQMEVSLSGAYFAEQFAYVDKQGRNDMCYVSFKVLPNNNVDLVILASTLTFVSTNGELKADQLLEIPNHQVKKAVDSIMNEIKLNA